MIARQATVVAIGGLGVLIEGAPGSGKSSLALALIDRGAVLVGDDSVMLEARDGVLIARPHPHTRGLIEVRNLGLLPMEPCDEAPVCLAVTLDPAAPRFIEQAGSVDIAGIALPQIQLWPDGAVLPIRVELALNHHGLRYGLSC